MQANHNINNNTVENKQQGIRVLKLEDTDKAARTLLEAFSEDDLANLLFSHVKDPVQKKYLEFELYKAYVKQHIILGVSLGIGEGENDFETVALWSVPFIDGIESLTTLLEAGYGDIWKMNDKVGRDKIFYGMLPLLHDSCERIIKNDSRFANKGIFTLVYLGTVKRGRGKGNVRRMFDFMFENFIDRSPDSIAYLESSSPTNIPIYNKFGFHFYEDITLGDPEKKDAVAGEDYAHMNIMIRAYKAHDWTKDENNIEGKL